MSSYTLSFSGNSSTLKTVLFPPLSLRSDRSWEIALLDFSTYHSIPNIVDGVNNSFHYFKEKDSNGNSISPVEIRLPTGSYEIEDINDFLKKQMGKDNIEIKANNNLLKVEIISKFYVDFSQTNSIGLILGFPPSDHIIAPNTPSTGSLTVDIIKVHNINITCNIVQGSYINGENKHILHTFYPTVPPGYKIIERPHNLVYLPINTSVISDVVLNVLDEKDNVVDFRGEVIFLRLHVKQVV